MRNWFGSSRITVACCTHGKRSTSERRSANGTLKILRSRSAPNTLSTLRAREMFIPGNLYIAGSRHYKLRGRVAGNYRTIAAATPTPASSNNETMPSAIRPPVLRGSSVAKRKVPRRGT